VKKLTEFLRAELKKPLGKIANTGEAIKAVARVHSTGGLVVSVGDSCSWELVRKGAYPDIIVYDHLCKRAPVEEQLRAGLDMYDGEGVVVKNPAGFITKELEEAIKRTLENKKGKILVDGEEDLGALPVLINAPIGTLVVYGQPDVGIVLVEVTEEKRRQALDIYLSMEDVG